MQDRDEHLTNETARLGQRMKDIALIQAIFRIEEKRREYVNLRAVLAGTSLVVSFILLTRYLGSVSSSVTTIDPYKKVLGTLFIGLSTGYFTGKSIGKEGGPIDSFLIGFFGSLAFIVLFVVEITILSGVLIFTAATAFLMYNSGLVDKHGEIEKWIGILVSVSLYGLAILAFVHYGVPILIEASLDVWETLMNKPMYIPIILFSIVAGIGTVLAVLEYTVGLKTVNDAISTYLENRIKRFVE